MAAPSLSLSRPLTVTAPGWTGRIAAAVALGAASPALAVVLGIVRTLCGGAPLVAHLRVGRHGESLWVFKVRTMWDGKQPVRSGWIEYLDDPPLPPSKSGLDPRVTSRFAAFCRRHSIDELPQLFHVAMGTMRWVGPRPMTQRELNQHYAGVQPELLSAPPGLTGLWQTMGRNRLTYAQRRRLDLFLVRRYGWGLCGRVLLRTIREVLRPECAW